MKFGGIEHRKCEVFAGTFQLSAEYGLESFDFVRKVMTSPKLNWLFRIDECQEWCDRWYLLDVLRNQCNLKFKEGKTIDPYVMWFAGYLYKYWMITRDVSRQEVYKILPFKRLVASFDFLHTQGWEFVIEESIRMYNDKSYII